LVLSKEKPVLPARAFTLKLLPRVKPFFELLLRSGCQQTPKIAIATNQGGVGMRYWMEAGGFGNPEKFPTAQEIEGRLRKILIELGIDPSIPVYASYRYQTREGEWTPIPREEADNPRWNSNWRKPQSGMLVQAMADAGVHPEETLFIGDSAEDQEAAQSAGCLFLWAEDFFNRDWSSCEDIDSFFSGPGE
jgi:HAD superfamily hydrolase (TIGR01662 family)